MGQELVWVLMYTVVTCCGHGAFGGKIYKPMFQEMPSEIVCNLTKGELKQMSTDARKFEAVRCEELMLPIER